MYSNLLYLFVIISLRVKKTNLYNNQDKDDLLFGEIFKFTDMDSTCSRPSQYLILHDLMLVSRQTANYTVLIFFLITVN